MKCGHSTAQSEHRSQLLSAEDAKSADRIFCVSERHKRMVLEQFPELRQGETVATLGEAVPDPWHQELP